MRYEPISGRFLCNSLVGWTSKSNPECQVEAVHSGESDNALFIVCPLHCCTPFMLLFWPFCISSLCHTVALHRFIRKTILVVSSTFCRNSRCKCLYIVQHLYKYSLSALSGGKKNRGILNRSIIFLCKKKEKIFKNGLKRIDYDLDMVFRSCTEK